MRLGAFELTTSSITNRMQGFQADAALLGPQIFGITPTMAGGLAKVGLLRSAEGAPSRNPIVGLNAGLIEFKRKSASETNVRLKLWRRPRREGRIRERVAVTAAPEDR
jgi:hypothetical protein